MYRPSKTVLRSLLISLLFLHPIAHAEADEPLQAGSQLQDQIQQLQTRVSDANGKIAMLETALNTANQNINALQNNEALKLNNPMQPGTNNSVARRTANGHGR